MSPPLLPIGRFIRVCSLLLFIMSYSVQLTSGSDSTSVPADTLEDAYRITSDFMSEYAQPSDDVYWQIRTDGTLVDESPDPASV